MVLVVLASIWLGILMGFGPEVARHVAAQGFAYPPILHLHALAFVGWLALLTVQVGLIGSGRQGLHRRLGMAGAVLALAMVVLGVATALIMDRQEAGQPGSDVAFLAAQLTDMAAFAGLAGAAIALRKDAAAHKRLILIATVYIADAGFARWLGEPLFRLFGGGGLLTFVAAAYLPNDLLILGMGGYDLVTRRRLHPAYVAALAWVAVNQLTASWLYNSAWWTPLATRMIGR